MHKENLLRIGTSAVLFGTLLLSNGCNTEAQSPIPIKAEATVTESLSFDLQQWQNKSPLQRINLLELKQKPTFPEFDFSKEFALATAQFYCQQIKCNKSAEEIASAVSVVDQDEFSSQLFKAGDEDQQATAMTMNGKVFINESRIKKLVQIATQTNLQNAPKGKDIETLVKTRIYFHEYNHLNSLDRRLNFGKFSLAFAGNGSTFAFDHMEGFRIFGKDSNNQSRIIQGADEGLTEFAANFIASKTNPERIFVSAPDYVDLTDLLLRLHRSAHISDDDVLKYVSGEKPVEEYLSRIGRLNKNLQIDDLRAGVVALFIVALRLDEKRSLEDVTEQLKTAFNLY